jgi:Flp pilus assembly protein TadG
VKSVKLDKERGQILVQVAFMVVALFAFVALALDGGQIYARRRQMQNAADASALAGAREICFGNYPDLETAKDAARDKAHEYAEDRNGSQPAQVDIVDDYTVTVVTSQTFDTFLAGIIGINNATVQAEASAMCGGAASAGYLWPLAFEYDVYDQDVQCGEDFWVFVNDPDPDADPVCASGTCECVDVGEEPLDKDDECYDGCNCSLIASSHIASDYRGWVRFEDPPEEIDSECEAGQGTDSLRCWIRNPYPAEIPVGSCARSESGGSIGVKHAVKDQIGEVAGIILWGDGCEDETHKSYYVAGFGCVELLDYLGPEDKIAKCGDPSKSCSHDHIIEARKLCTNTVGYTQCASLLGSAAGVPEDLEYRSVSLTR